MGTDIKMYRKAKKDQKQKTKTVEALEFEIFQ